MSFIRWMIESLASEDVIDGYFIMSDLKDINQTEAEIQEYSDFDSRTMKALTHRGDDDTPIGKQVC